MLLDEEVETTVAVLEDGKRYNTSSSLTLQLTWSHHNQNISCTASSPADPAPRSAWLSLQVRSRPQVLLAGPGPGLLQEGGVARFICLASAHPPVLQYSWSLAGMPVLGFRGPNLTLANLTRSQHGARVECAVRNAVGRALAGAKLRLRCKWRVWLTSKLKQNCCATPVRTCTFFSYEAALDEFFFLNC